MGQVQSRVIIYAIFVVHAYSMLHTKFQGRRSMRRNFFMLFIIYQGVHGQGKSQGKKYFFKVRELSGNFEICQGILEFKQTSGKSQGILK